jgi:uncharacterized protein YwqG
MRIAERLFDLGPAGMLRLTLGNFGSWEPPFPANLHGRANLYVGSEVHDRLDVLSRLVPRATIEATIADARSRLVRAVREVHKNIDWVAQQVSDDFREAPCQALPMAGGLMFVTFAGATKPNLLRVVDVARGKILWEAAAHDVAARCGITAKSGFGANDNPLLEAAGARHVALLMYTHLALLEWTGSEMRPVSWLEKLPRIVDLNLTAAHVVLQPDREKNEYQVLDANSGKVVSRFEAPTRSKGWARPVTSPGNERIVLPAEGGTADIVDGFGSSSFAIRPYPRLGRKDTPGCALSFGGAYLGVNERQSFRVVDLARRKVAEIPVPAPSLSDTAGELVYDSDRLASDSLLTVVYHRGVMVHAYESLDWQPVIEPGKRGAAGAKRQPRADYEAFLAGWRKPALTLMPATRARGRSHLYGSPRIPAAQCPVHDGVSMALLAEIDLAEVGEIVPDSPWPKSGVLCFFAAVDAQGEVLHDDMFNPRRVKVVWCEHPLEKPVDPSRIDAQRLMLSAHKADLPDIVSAAVTAAGLDDRSLEAYRSFLEENDIADQPSGHRFGGYPTIIQSNDLEAQAAHFGEGADYPPADLDAVKRAAKWRLLLQLDSDDELMWGTDSGMVYFLINDEDLRRKNFDRVAAVCEGF